MKESPQVNCVSTNEGFQYWAGQESISADLSESILTADVLLVPTVGYGEFDGNVFPVGTEELFAHLKRPPRGNPIGPCGGRRRLPKVGPAF